MDKNSRRISAGWDFNCARLDDLGEISASDARQSLARGGVAIEAIKDVKGKTGGKSFEDCR
jgi:hypothetical protein